MVLFAVVIFTAVVLWLTVPLLVPGGDEEAQVRGDSVQLDTSRPPGPLLQPHPPADLEELRKWESSILESYGWSDRAAGTARVPVEEARRRVLDRGLPSFSATTVDPSMETSEEDAP